MSDLDLRPNWRTYRRWFTRGIGAAVALVVLVVVAVVSASHDQRGLVGLAATLAIVLLIALIALGHVAIMIHTSSLRLRGTELTHCVYGRGTTIRLDGRVRGLLAPLVTTTGRGGTRIVDLLVLVDPEGRTIRLNGGYWPRADLEAVAHLAGARTDTGHRGTVEWERDLPGSMSFAARRPFATALMILGVIFALFAVAIAVAAIVSG